MSRKPLGVDELWAIPRVGTPLPLPGGDLLVPVRSYSMADNEGRTRLWQVPADASTPEEGRALTAEDTSSDAPAVDAAGTAVAFTRKPGKSEDEDGPRFGDKPQLHVLSLSGGEARCVTDLPLGVKSPKWFPDGRRVAFIAELHADALTPEGTAKKVAERDENPVKAAVTEERVYRVWDRWVAHGEAHHIFMLDLETDALVDLTPRWPRWMGLMDVDGAFDIAPDGREIAFHAIRSRPPYKVISSGVFTVRVPARPKGARSTERHREITPKEAASAYRPVYSPDGRWLVFGMQREHDFYADRVRLVARDRRTRATRVLTEDWDRSCDDYAFSPDGKALYVTAETYGRSGLFAVDMASAWKKGAIKPRELNRGGSYGSLRVTDRHVWATPASISAPPEVVSWNRSGKSEKRRTFFTQAIMKSAAIGKVEEIIFDGAEGAPIQMYVVHPAPKSGRATRAKKQPLVHLVHGGPHGTFGDQWHWRWNAQVFAGAGYAVAMVNFHGSTSWGQDFAASIHGEWGKKPYADVMRATDVLVEKGFVDEKRMAVAGASYGGYLVSWIGANTNRFRCIVNHAGVCDLQTQFASDFTQGRKRAIGSEPWEDAEIVDAYSPMRHAAGFKSPMLITHGEKDYRVPYVQALQLYNVYKARNIPARLVVYPDENHWILKPRNSQHWYGEVLAWLERWMKKSRRRR